MKVDDSFFRNEHNYDTSSDRKQQRGKLRVPEEINPGPPISEVLWLTLLLYTIIWNFLSANRIMEGAESMLVSTALLRI